MFSTPFPEFIKNIGDVPRDDAQVLGWCALQLFRKTVCRLDESSQHAIYILETPHPCDAITTPYVEKIFIPGAEKLFIEINKLSQVEDNAILFFENESLTIPRRNVA
jgi:hypothetical protein